MVSWWTSMDCLPPECSAPLLPEACSGYSRTGCYVNELVRRMDSAQALGLRISATESSLLQLAKICNPVATLLHQQRIQLREPSI
mmetsp:Transcript_67517/g.162053  ORF Transcript_67517/g.162053 Transcript_67517/m.162053 type:complete len:85 (-) Transcript_67517:5818-6072(-)